MKNLMNQISSVTGFETIILEDYGYRLSCDSKKQKQNKKKDVEN